MTWYDITNFLLIALCIWVILRKYNSLPNEIKILLIYFILTLILEICSEYYILQGLNNLYLYHLIVPVQYFIICYYFLILLDQRKNKIIIAALLFSIMLMWIMSFFINTLSDYFSFASVFKNLIICFFILFYFNHVFNNSLNYEKDKNINIWIATGLFINSLGNFFIEGSMNYLMDENRSIATNFYFLHIGLNFLFYIVFILVIAFQNFNIQE